MKELTRNIVSSRQDRANGIGRTKAEAKRIMKEAASLTHSFATSRQQAAEHLSKDLALNQTKRKAEVKRALSDARGLVTGFHTSRGQKDAVLRRDLAQRTASRRSEVIGARSQARKAVDTFRSQRKVTAARLRKELAIGGRERKSEVKGLAEGARDLLAGFADSRGKAGRALRDELAKARADRASEARARAAKVDQMRTSFMKSRKNVRADLVAAKAAWGTLSAGKPATEPASSASLADRPGTREGASGQESPDLEAKLLAAVNEHPLGITLTQIADGLGVVPVVLGRASKRLVDEGKVRKEDKSYFPSGPEQA